MANNLVFLPRTEGDLDELAADRSKAKQLKTVQKALGLLQKNVRHPGLQTHKFHSLKGPQGQEVFEAYAEHRTPAAYRIFLVLWRQSQRNHRDCYNATPINQPLATGRRFIYDTSVHGRSRTSFIFIG
jgi:hypothetical protein